MTHSIPIKELTLDGLKFFLKLLDTQEGDLTKKKLNKKDLCDRLCKRIGAEHIQPLDINYIGPEILKVAGLSDIAIAELRDKRPFYSYQNIKTLTYLNNNDKKILNSVFEIPTLSYHDVGNDTLILLEPNIEAPQLVIDSLDVEAVNSNKYEMNYRLASESEQEESGLQYIPAYSSESGGVRYLDPRFIAVQVNSFTDELAIDDLFIKAGCFIVRAFATSGLFLVKLISERHGVGALNRALAVLSGAPVTMIAEPAWISFDEIENDTRFNDEIEEASVHPWNLKLINAQEFSEISSGNKSVTLVCIDTGVDHNHPAIASAIIAQPTGEVRNFFLEDDSLPSDDKGHGTAVAGILVGNGHSGVVGLAPNCKLLPIKVPLKGTLSSYVLRREALLSLIERIKQGEQLIINLSWRTTGDVALVRTAIEMLSDAGAIIVCSAGNGNTYPDQPHFPSDYPATISVSAVTEAGLRAAYSYFGSEVDIAAPGGDDVMKVLCADLDGGVQEVYGTSFAAPHVAGALGLVWSITPSLSAAQVRQLVESAVETSQEVGLGSGILNLGQLLKNLIRAGLIDAELNGGENPEEKVFPISGQRLAELSVACTVKSISRRIFKKRPLFVNRDDIRSVLGVTDGDLICLMRAIDGS